MDTDLARALRTLRTHRGLTQAEVAAKARIAVSTLRRWEGGASEPRLPELDACLKALRATAEERSRILGSMAAPRAAAALKTEATITADAAVPLCGDLVRALRGRAGLSANQLAARLSVHPSQVTRWEHSEVALPQERLDELFGLLGAQQEERDALMRGVGSLALPESSLTTLDACDAFTTELTARIDAAPYALADLEFLRLEAILTRQAVRDERALTLLARAYASHASSLALMTRRREAIQLAERALALVVGRTAPEPFWIRAVGVIAHCAVHRKTPPDGRRGIETLLRWQDIAEQVGALATFYRELADHASWAKQPELATQCLAQAARATHSGAPADGRLLNVVQLRVLLAVGRLREAARCLEQCDEAATPHLRVFELVHGIDLLIELGQKAEAAQWLRRFYAYTAEHALEYQRCNVVALERLL